MFYKSCAVPKALPVILLLCGWITCSRAQPEPMHWGSIPRYDLLMSRYDKDTSASAVILCDYANLSVEPVMNEYRVVFYRQVRIKIFNKAGYSSGNIEIILNRKQNEEIHDIRAHSVTLSPNQRDSIIKELNPQDILSRDINDNYSKVVFAVPGIQEGSVIEFSYKIYSNDLFNYHTWIFQYNIPVLWSELRAELTGVYNYMVLFHNISDSLTINQKTDGYKIVPAVPILANTLHAPVRIHSIQARYVMKDIPALEQEPFITCMDDYRKEIRFQLYSITKPYTDAVNIIRTWKELVELLNDNDQFGKWLLKESDLKSMLKGVHRKWSPEKERMKLVYDYVKSHFRWNGTFRILAGQQPDEMIRIGGGNSAEINLLLVQAMRAAGLKADPVLLSTRAHGKIQKDFPILNQFNHVICVVRLDTLSYLLDATDPFRPYNVLAPEDLNYTGMIISGNTYRWIEIRNTDPSKRNSLLTLRLDSMGNVMGNLIITETGHFANNGRIEITNSGRAKYASSLLNFLSIDVRIDSSEVDHLAEIDLPLKISIVFSGKNLLKQITHNDVIYFDATLLNVFSENPFKPRYRNYPVDFNYPYEDVSTLVVEIPEGYAIDEVPEEEHIIVPDSSAEFIFKVSNTTEVFQIMSDFRLKKTIFPPKEYVDLRTLFDVMVRKNSEHVIAIRDE